MKFFRSFSLILAMALFALLVIGNLIPQTVRNWIKKDSIILDIQDAEIKKLSLQQMGDYAFNVVPRKSLYSPYERIILVGSLVNKSDRTIPHNAVIEVEFLKDDQTLRNIDGKSRIKMAFDPDLKIWTAAWYPENPNLSGDIRIVARGFLNSPEKSLEIENRFYIDIRHNYKILPKGISYLGISDKNLISKRSILSAQAKTVNWNYIPNWMNIINADGVMMLGGLTETYRDDTTLERPWQKAKITEALALGDRIQQIGGVFSVWIKGLEVEGRRLEKVGYQPCIYLTEKGPDKDLARISLLDQARKSHITELLNQYIQDKSTTSVGLSHIFSTRKHDIELLEKFMEESGLELIDNLDRLSPEQKWDRFSQKLNDPSLSALFNKWKSYAYYDYLKSIISKVSHQKTLFYMANIEELFEFPELLAIVFNAGFDFVTLNISGDFEQINTKMNRLRQIPDFEVYFNRVVLSYEVDIDDFEKADFESSAIENYIYANLDMLYYTSRYYPAQGLMINGLFRIMPGRRGPYPSNAWMLGFGDLLTRFQSGVERRSLHLDYVVSETNPHQIQLNLQNTSQYKIEDIRLQFLPAKDQQDLEKYNRSLPDLKPGAQTNLSLSLNMSFSNSQFLEKKHFFGMRLSWKKPAESFENPGLLYLIDLKRSSPAVK